MADEQLTVTITYRPKQAEVQRVSLRPETYFDPLDESEHRFEPDSTPRFAQLADYVQIDRCALDFVEVSIVDQASGRCHTRREVFWGPHWLSYMTDAAADGTLFTEILLEVQESTGNATQLLKVNRTTADLEVVMHLLTHTGSSGGYESESLK